MTPGHADQVQQTFFDRVSRSRDIIDSGRVHDRQIKVTLYLAGKFKMRGLGCPHIGDQGG